MAYNIDNWKTKELVDLRIPVASLFKHERKDWHPSKKVHDDLTVEFVMGECSYIRGNLNAAGDWLAVIDIKCCGEGSGTVMNWIFVPALKDSTGRVVAACVWEGGDSIKRLTVQDGSIAWEDVEI